VLAKSAALAAAVATTSLDVTSVPPRAEAAQLLLRCLVGVS